MSESRANGIHGRGWRAVLGGGALIVLLLLCGSYFVWAVRFPHLLVLFTLPVPPEAQMVYDARRSLLGDMVFATDIFYRIDRSGPEMASYYQKEMGERGWRLVTEEKRGSSSCIVFQRGPFLTSVEVLAGTAVTLEVGSSGCDAFSHDPP